MIKGDKIWLRAIERSDLKQLLKWRNNPKLRRNFREWRELNMQNQEDFFNDMVMNSNHVVFGIEDEDHNLIGVCRISYIDWQARSGEIGCYIGDEEKQNQGYGTDALRTLVEFGFEEAGLHRLEAAMLSDNISAVKSFTKAGFKQEGVMRDATYCDGRFHDHVLMSMLRSDYDKIVQASNRK